MRSIAILTLALLAGFASSASAESNSGMHYTRIQETAPDSGTTHIRMKTVLPEGEEPPKQEETPSTRIWNKYKALASGAPEKTEEEKAAEKEAQEKEEAGQKAAEAEKQKEKEAAENAKIEKVEREPAPPTGIAAIIDEYRKNKAQRSQMRTITVTNPDFQPSAGTPAKPGSANPQ